VDRFLEVYRSVDPSIAVLPDVYSEEEAVERMELVDDLLEEHPHRRLIVPPKCEEAFDVLDDTVTLGFANGYSSESGFDVADARRWWRHDAPIHILGGSVDRQVATIDSLTGPTLAELPPAEVVGLDSNTYFRMAHWEYWTPDGWKDSYVSPRKTVRRSLENVREYLEDRGLWPGREWSELFGEAVRKPDDLVHIDTGGSIRSQSVLEDSIVEEYPDLGVVAFDSEKGRRFVEYREGLN